MVRNLSIIVAATLALGLSGAAAATTNTNTSSNTSNTPSATAPGTVADANLFGGTTLPNPASERIYRASGFELCGVWRNAGYKQGRWHDVGWYQRTIR